MDETTLQIKPSDLRDLWIVVERATGRKVYGPTDIYCACAWADAAEGEDAEADEDDEVRLQREDDEREEQAA